MQRLGVGFVRAVWVASRCRWTFRQDRNSHRRPLVFNLRIRFSLKFHLKLHCNLNWGFLPGLPFRKRRILKWPGFFLDFLRHRIALYSSKRMPVLADYHVIDFRQIHWFRGIISLTCCREQKADFLSVESVNVVVLLHLGEIDNYFGRNV